MLSAVNNTVALSAGAAARDCRVWHYRFRRQGTLDEVVKWLMESGHIPSFCTACYREGRTCDRFMSLCKNGQILNCCHPNALMTLSEYLEDYAFEDTKRVGNEIVERELERIPKEKVREIARQNIKDINGSNRRDLRF